LNPLKILNGFRWWKEFDADLRTVVATCLPKLRLYFAAGCWLLAAGCELLAADCWLLAAGIHVLQHAYT
jgi:hypothetical protein